MNKEKREKIINIWNTNSDALTFKDFYDLPFKDCKISSWCFDQNNYFAFQCDALYEDDVDYPQFKKLLDVINDTPNIKPFECKTLEFKISDSKQRIYYRTATSSDWKILFMIRGYGNLTGTGAYNFPHDIAAKIQDTLGDYIYDKLLKHLENGKEK